MKEENVDAMKYRKSTHLAGIDVDCMDNKVFTIKKCWYETGVNVSGNKTDGYFMSFIEDVKDMVVNTINRTAIINIVKNTKELSYKECRNTANWEGLKIALYFDESVKMMGKKTGGIRIKTQSPIPSIDPKEAIKLLETSSDLDSLKLNWSKLSKQEQSLPEVVSLKDKIKLTFE